jgi:class 3 adenylate cyclase/DNA-binding CsgD family transcriptional regulator
LPTGVVSFVLTDVVGSTGLWERAPDVMAVALARHDELVSMAVVAEGGTVVKSRGEGDSTFSVFNRASDALRAAHRLQAAMRAESWPPAAVVRTRAAVHTGEAVERDGDYFGPAVNRVARLRGAAWAGELIVSAATAAIVGSALPAGWELVDIGTVELRDLGPQDAFLLAAPGLDTVQRSRPRASTTGKPVPGGGVSRREAEVLELVVENWTNAEIAARLFISERTVESHVSSLLRKLGAADRRELSRRGGPSVAAESPAAARLPSALELLADPTSFVGRVVERETLRERWRLAVAGHTLLVVVAAEAGMGKSRLVAELAAEVHAEGGKVLFGACFEDVEEPYGPFAQAIAGDAAGLDSAEIVRRAGDAAPALARMSPDLARAIGDTALGADDLAAAGAVMEGIRRWLTASAALAPLLVVIEDLHWSTSTTRSIVRDLVRTAGRAPVLIVATTRDTAPDLDSDLAGRLADLERAPSVTRVELGGLDRDEVTELLAAEAGDVDVIVAETGGNPLLVTHVAADSTSGSLRLLLTRRDALVDAECRHLLDLAAVFGAEFDAVLLADGAGLPLLTVLEALEAAEAAGWVVPLPGRPGRFAFVHALFRSHRYDALPVRRRLELHAAAAVALAGSADGLRLSERARHACLAVPVGDAASAVELAREAGHEAEHAYAYDEAVGHYRRALEASRSLDPPERGVTLDLRVRLAAALHRAGEPDGLPMLLDAGRRARDEGDDAALIRASISLSHLGATSAYLYPDPAQIDVVEDALAVLGPEPSAMRARLLSELAVQLGDSSVERGIALATEAESIARGVGDADVLGFVLLRSRHIGRHPRRLQEHLRRAVELETLGRRSRSVVLTLAGLNAQALLYLERAELDTSFERGDRFLRLLDDRHLPFFQLTAQLQRAARAFLAGDLEGAEHHAMATAPFATSIRHPPTSWSAPTVGCVRRLQARDAESIEPLERAVDRRGETATFRAVLAATQARSGALEDAHRTLIALRDSGYRFPEGYGWAHAMSELAEAADVAGDREAGVYVLSECSRYASRIVLSGPTVVRPVDQVLAQAALAAGDATVAEACATRAVVASRERRTPVFLCRELVFLAETHRRNGASSAQVRALVQEALTVAEPIGAHVVDVDVARYGLPS